MLTKFKNIHIVCSQVLVKTVLVMLFVFLANIAKTQTELKNVSLQLKWWHQFQFAGYYAAQVKGYFKDAGLQVELKQSDSAHNPVDEVVKGNATFGVTGADLLLDFANGKPVMVLGAIFQHSPYVIISLEKNKITKPSDLVGKRVMASKGQGWVLLEMMLIKEGISPDSIKQIEHTWKNNDLISGYADAMTGYVSVEVNQLKKINAKPTYINPQLYGVDFYGDVLFATKHIVNEDAAMVDLFRQACFKGWEYAMTHVDELADYILTLPGVKERGVTKQDLVNEAEAMRNLIFPGLVQMGHMNPGRWQHIEETYKTLNVLKKDVDLSKFMFVPKQNNNAVYLYWLFIVAAVLGFLVVVIFIYNILLRRAVKKEPNR